MKKNLTKKLMLSVLTLAFAVVSLGASTFAWFTLSKDAQINAFDMTVKAGSGIEMRLVSIDGTSKTSAWYTNEIPTNVVNEFVNINGKLDAVTGLVAGEVVTGIYERGNQTKAATTYNSGKYVGFKLQFKLSNATDKEVYPLNLAGYTLETKVPEDFQPWVANANFVGLNCDNTDEDSTNDTYEAGKPYYYFVSDAARLAITVTNGKQFIYESTDSKDDKHVEFTSGQSTENNAAFNYYNVITPDAKLTAEQAKDNQYKISKLSSTGQELGNVTQLAEGAEYSLELQVWVWVEGWDAECINAIFAQTLTTALSFELPTAGEIE